MTAIPFRVQFEDAPASAMGIVLAAVTCEACDGLGSVEVIEADGSSEVYTCDECPTITDEVVESILAEDDWDMDDSMVIHQRPADPVVFFTEDEIPY